MVNLDVKQKAYNYIKNHGYTPGQTGREFWNLIQNNENLENDKATESDVSAVDTWLNSCIDSDWSRSAKEVWNKETLDSVRDAGILCSTINVYFRNLERQKEKEINQSNPENQYGGNIGDVVEFKIKEFKIDGYRSGMSYYASDYPVYKIKSEDGKTYIWGCANRTELHVGDTLKGRVKRTYETREGIKITEITRCKITATATHNIRSIFDLSEDLENLDESEKSIRLYCPTLDELIGYKGFKSEYIYRNLETNSSLKPMLVSEINSWKLPMVNQISLVIEGIKNNTEKGKKAKEFLLYIWKKYFEESFDLDSLGYSLVISKSKRSLHHYGEGTHWCVSGMLGKNSEDVKNGKGKPGDFRKDRASHFQRYYYNEKNYSYYWGILLNDSDKSEKYLIGFDRDTGKIREFRGLYDNEITSLPGNVDLQTIKTAIEKKFNEFKNSSSYEEILNEDITTWSPDMEDDRGTVLSDVVYCHCTSSPGALYNILNRISRDGEVVDYNLGSGHNSTVSVTNQFIRGKEFLDDKFDLPGPILRNNEKFRFGIVFSKDVLNNVPLEEYRDLENYFNHPEDARLSDYTRVQNIYKFKNGSCYLKIFYWPGIFKISEDLFDRIKYICENNPNERIRNSFKYTPKASLNHLSKNRGGKFSRDDILYTKGFPMGGPRLVNNEFFKDFERLSTEEMRLKLDDKNAARSSGGRKTLTADVYISEEEIKSLVNSFQGDEKEKRSLPGVQIAFEDSDVTCIWFPDVYLPSKEFKETNLSDWRANAFTSKFERDTKIFNMKKFYELNFNLDELLKGNEKYFRKNETLDDYCDFMEYMKKILKSIKDKNIPIKFYSWVDYKPVK